ncbi:MAG: 3-phosphoshikimate 1-carboxyvinyltransferase [Clostridia bacterium]|nr:3-phosphoshikimate 1-carboxyvinyltransferase [Clostridia bacterium]
MDTVKIKPHSLSGTVKVPPSKSFAHRAVISAFLSGEECKISNLSASEDILATLSCISSLGADVAFDEKKAVAVISKGQITPFKKLCLDCRESGSTLRFFIPIALCFAENIEFTGAGRLMKRPLKPYFDIFDKIGITYKQKAGKLQIKGRLTPGDFYIDGSVSSQFVTGLLFALPCLDGDSRIIIEGGLSSKGYIDITLDVLKKYGIEVENENYNTFVVKGNQKYKQRNFAVEGDFSQAAFFLVAGAIGCDVTCTGLRENSLQGDKKILEIIEKTGAHIEKVGTSKFRAVSTSTMHGITVDADEIPDLVPIMAVLFAFCKGESRIINAGRLRIKESDRLAAITSELKKMGATIKEDGDSLIVCGKQVLSGAQVSSHNDHRIAMATAVAACRCEGEVTIEGANKAVKKSYPDFFKAYKKLGGKTE